VNLFCQFANPDNNAAKYVLRILPLSPIGFKGHYPTWEKILIPLAGAYMERNPSECMLDFRTHKQEFKGCI